MKNEIKLSDVIKCLGSSVISINGEVGDRIIDNLSDVEHTTEKTLDWVKPTNPNRQLIVEESPAKVILVDESIAYNERIKEQKKTLIVVKSPRNAIAKVGNCFFVQKPPVGIHPTAIVDESADIGDNVSIGPYSVIGNVKIGNNTIIGSHSRIYDSSVIGNNCRIDDHVVIGGQGFGFEKDDNGNWMRFPQLGFLEIGDYVEIGSFTAVDRGALSFTRIGDYTKIDSLCKIGHNVVIGKNVIITACTVISGSNVIADNVWIGPNATLKDWGAIGEGAFVGMGSVVIRKVKAGKRVFGTPAVEIEY